MKTRIEKVHDIADAFFYLGLILIVFSGWKYGWFGIQKENPPAEIPFIIFLVLRVIEKPLKLKRDQLEELILVSIMLMYSVIAFVLKRYELPKLINGINIFGWYYCCYFAVHTYMKDASRDKILSVLKCIKSSYWLAIGVGAIQFMNIYIHTFGWYDEFIGLFSINHNDIFSRVRLSFSEPSEASTYICFLYIPVLLLLKEFKYKFRVMDMIQMALLGVLSIMTFSILFYSTLFVVLLCYLISGKKIIKSMIFLMLLFAIYLALYFSGSFDSLITSDRIRLLLTNPIRMIMRDNSIRTRMCYYFVTWHSLSHNFIFGYGWNYFHNTMKDVMNSIPSGVITAEFIYTTMRIDTFVSYEALFSVPTCGGAIGIIWLLKIIKTRFISDINILKPIVRAYLISLFLGQGLLRSIPIIVFMELCSNSQVKIACEETL